MKKIIAEEDARVLRMLNEAAIPPNAGYHITYIPKGVIGEFSKIKEELLEAEDAITQGCKIMELVELSDLLGALELYVQKKFNMTLDDLKSMSAITQRAFRNGKR